MGDITLGVTLEVMGLGSSLIYAPACFAERPELAALATASAQVEAARKQGLRITADMSTYTAGATGLDASMPLWVQAGGTEA